MKIARLIVIAVFNLALYNLPIFQSSNAASAILVVLLLRRSQPARRQRLAAISWSVANGVYVGAPLNEKWPSTGPRVIWRKQIGQGLSGPVVAGHAAHSVSPR